MTVDPIRAGRFVWLLPLLALALFSSACGRVAPLANGQPSSSALADAVLDALARRDATALRALALDESEFRAHVWPSLPSARPERNLPFSYVWGELRQKSDASLAETLTKRGGRRYQLVDVRFEGESTQYSGYVVHRGTVLRVRNDAGEEESIRVCGSLLEKDGVWKVFSYVVDD